MGIHEIQYNVSFGDCDPAGIVFYPNIFSWFDRAFHGWLMRFGGHAKLCKELDSIGIGLIDASAQFYLPMRDGDTLTLILSIEEWRRKSLHLVYEGHVGERLTVGGREVRGLFMRGAKGMFASEIEELRRVVESNER